VYVKTADGEEVGHVDLVARIVVAKAPGYETELQESLLRWTGAPEVATEEAGTEALTCPVADEPATGQRCANRRSSNHRSHPRAFATSRRTSPARRLAPSGTK
jgi:hypothetical protein